MDTGVSTKTVDFKETMRALFCAHTEAEAIEERFRSIGCDIQDTGIYFVLASISNAMLLLHPAEGDEPDQWCDDLTRIKNFEDFWNKYYEGSI